MPCVKKMALRQGDTPGSGCHRDCLHRAAVEEYRWMRQASEEAAEYAAGSPASYPTEWAEYVVRNPLFTFRQFLAGRSEARHREDTQATTSPLGGPGNVQKGTP